MVIKMKLKNGACEMRGRSKVEMLSLRTYSQEISCPSAMPLFINATFPMSFASWTSANGMLLLAEQKLKKGAKKMKITKASKFVVFVTAIVFMSTQVLPVGWALDPQALSKKADADQALTKSAGDAADPAANANQTKTASVVPPAGSVDFLMGAGSGSSPASSEPAEAAATVASQSPATPVVPPTVVATVPDASGRVTLAGTVTPSSYVYYSFDNKTWSIADSTTSSGAWSREITLPSTGTTEIYVRAKKGTDYSASVVTTVTFTVPAPVVNVSVPNAEGRVTLSGTAPAGYTIYYSVNGGSPMSAGIVSTSGAWTKSGILLTNNGTNAISVYAKKAKFQSESVSVNVNFNSTVPVPTLAVTAPDARGRVMLTGTVTPDQIVSYSVNGQTWLTADITTHDGLWSKEITLPAAGTTTIYVRATDTVARRSSEIVTREVTFIVAAPTANASVPTVQGRVTLSGTVTPSQIVQYSLDGETWQFAGYSESGTWSKEITLPATGTTTIRTRSKLNSGNFYSESVLTPVTFTIPAPVVAVTEPGVNGKVRISGTGIAGYTIYYSVNGGPATAGGTVSSLGNWAKSDILLPNVGSNTIVVYAKKGNFQSESASVNINFNLIASVPVVEATAPDASGKVTLSGTATPGMLLQYSLDGERWMGAGIARADGTWESRQITLLATGTTTILVRAKTPNHAIYSESVSKVVTFNVPVPTVTSTTPDANGRVVLSGTVTAGQTVQYSFDGVKWLTADALTSTGAWSSYPITLPATGTTTIYTRAKLRYGNFYSDSVSTIVTFAIPAPTISATVPDAARKVILSGTVTPGHYVQYSFDGTTWLIADSTTSTGAWSSRAIVLPTGINSVYVRAMKGKFYSDQVVQVIA